MLAPPLPGSHHRQGQRWSCRCRRPPASDFELSQSDNPVWDADWKTDWRCSSNAQYDPADTERSVIFLSNIKSKIKAMISCSVIAMLPQSSCLLQSSAAAHTEDPTLIRHLYPAGQNRRHSAPPSWYSPPSEEGQRETIGSGFSSEHNMFLQNNFSITTNCTVSHIKTFCHWNTNTYTG